MCPQCGRTLYVRNQEHVCGLYDLDGHFDGRDPIGRFAFDWICSIFESLGSYDILPMKTTIAFAHGVNIAFLKTQKKGAEISIVMPRALSSPRITGFVPYSRTKAIYRIPVSAKLECDGALKDWLLEAYSEGMRP
jgi:hypothetical protein